MPAILCCVLLFEQCYHSAHPLRVSQETITHLYGVLILVFIFFFLKTLPFFWLKGNIALQFLIPGGAGIHSQTSDNCALLSEYIAQELK